MYKIVIFWLREVQSGRRNLAVLVASAPLPFAASEDSHRNIVKGRAWTKADDMASMKAFVIASGDAKKGVSQKRADFLNTVFTVRKFGMENNPEYNVPGLWASRSAQPVFQKYKRLKADRLIFEGEFRRVSGIHPAAEPHEDFVRTATAGFRGD
jgi:hypothetical protein